MSSGGLSNDDFRALLATPRHGGGGGGGGQKQQQGNKEKKPRPARPPPKFKQGKALGEEGEEGEEEDGPKSRRGGAGERGVAAVAGRRRQGGGGARVLAPSPHHHSHWRTHRDRASERRKGFSADYEGVPDDLVGLLEGGQVRVQGWVGGVGVEERVSVCVGGGQAGRRGVGAVHTHTTLPPHLHPPTPDPPAGPGARGV